MVLVLDLIETEIQRKTMKNLTLILNPLCIYILGRGHRHSRSSIAKLQKQKQKQIFLYTILKLYMYAILIFIAFLFKFELKPTANPSIFKSLFYNFNFKRR